MFELIIAKIRVEKIDFNFFALFTYHDFNSIVSKQFFVVYQIVVEDCLQIGSHLEHFFLINRFYRVPFVKNPLSGIAIL